MKPERQVDRAGTVDLRKKILSISYSNCKNLVFSKGALCYIEQKVRANEPFSLNQRVVERPMQWRI